MFGGYFDVVGDDLADIVSSSFGECEKFFTAPYNGIDQTGLIRAQAALFKQGNAQGQTFVAASGDSSGLGCPAASYFAGQPAKFVAGIDEPASSPKVTAVGGTNLTTTAPPNPQPSPPVLTSKYVAESEFADREIPHPFGFGVNVTDGLWGSGSGTSVVFERPSYQNGVVRSNMRSIPYVSLQMGGCPGGLAILPCSPDDSAAIVAIDGKFFGVIGTSVGAPEFAGLLALKAAAIHSRLGNVNPLIYQMSAANNAHSYHFFHQGIPGYNGIVREARGTTGYSQIVGVGTPYAANFLGLNGSPLAGDPQTVTNP